MKEAGANTRSGSLKAATARPKRDYKSRRRVINKICEFRWTFLQKVIFILIIFPNGYFKIEIERFKWLNAKLKKDFAAPDCQTIRQTILRGRV
ncbi:hypothetical protein [Methanoculleus sp.]|uniref:hypothetical protein n=1 Tax=Methanoculleus sp. TaxID=90427 RepID=UPI0025E1221B|nr:hypothetical protein [Methanoculleus sp.]MCK9319175.1 hypothetical protein [Methanoculleus sp.]MDD2254964.1 hypothetical protein [Methanoculleus sp.]